MTGGTSQTGKVHSSQHSGPSKSSVPVEVNNEVVNTRSTAPGNVETKTGQKEANKANSSQAVGKAH